MLTQDNVQGFLIRKTSSYRLRPNNTSQHTNFYPLTERYLRCELPDREMPQSVESVQQELRNSPN